MEGINFVTDERDEKVAVMIDLKKYGALWEDFYDTIIAASRAHEEAAPWQKVRQSLEEAGRLGYIKSS
jgi:hypothetical protein